MKHFSAIASTAALSAALMLPGMVFAGNIRQYTFKKGGPAYSELTDDVKIVPESWTPQTIIFKDGKVKLDAFEKLSRSASPSATAVRNSTSSLRR